MVTRWPIYKFQNVMSFFKWIWTFETIWQIIIFRLIHFSGPFFLFSEFLWIVFRKNTPPALQIFQKLIWRFPNTFDIRNNLSTPCKWCKKYRKTWFFWLVFFSKSFHIIQQIGWYPVSQIPTDSDSKCFYTSM